MIRISCLLDFIFHHSLSADKVIRITDLPCMVSEGESTLLPAGRLYGTSFWNFFITI